jgi:hypothetical protein
MSKNKVGDSPDLELTISLREHIEIVNGLKDQFHEERDRRYAEVNIEKEKALKIKETADLAALQLAREIQTYKDEKANELREQISNERGLYATKDDLANMNREWQATIKPISDYVSGQRGVQEGIGISGSVLVALIGVVAGVAAVIGLIVGLT